MNYPIIGDSWVVRTTLTMPREILLSSVFDANNRRHRLQILYPATGVEVPINSKHEPFGGHVLFNPLSHKLVYLSVAGIVAHNLDGRNETVLVDVDPYIFDIQLIGLSPDGNHLCYFERKRGTSIYELAAGAEEKAGSEETELFLVECRTKKHTLIARLPRRPISGAVEWSENALYATFVETGSAVELSRVEFTTGLSTRVALLASPAVNVNFEGSVYPFQDPQRISLLGNGSFLLSSLIDSGVRVLAKTGQQIILTSFGRDGALSSDGSRLAFTRRVGNELWLKNGNEEPKRVYAFSSQGISNKPTWCPCGNHVAVCLTDTGNLHKQILLIADCTRKELLVNALHQSTSSGTFVWLPSESKR